MVRKYLLPALAIAGLAFAIWTTIQGAKTQPPSRPVTEPPRSPFPSKISGSGIVEASTRNISIGSHVPGIVARVFVTVGKRVRSGEPLFVLDDRKQQADLAVKEAALAEARARLARLRQAPRPEDLPPAQARVKEAEAILAEARHQLQLAEKLKDARAIAIDEINKRRFAVEAAEARLNQAKADLKLLEAGSWKQDIEVAMANVARAKAEVDAARVEIDRLTVRAPVEGDILQVNIRPGEFASSGTIAVPLILLGNLDKLHVRVDIDENDAWRYRPEAQAIASIRGNPQLKTDLTFEYVEAYVVPKRSLTGESTERVDTRVMQVVYSFKRGKLPIYPGQLMDVFIDERTPRPEQPVPCVEKEGKK
ncbi:MAG: HlyD family secretion protein [Thermodesulfobacteriota bacterium]